MGAFASLGSVGKTDPAEIIADTRGIPVEGIREAERRGLLRWEKRRGHRCYRYGDKRNAGCSRRVDNEPFRIGQAHVKAVAVSRGEQWHWPIGLDDIAGRDAREIILCEGAPDGLAAFAFAEIEARTPHTGVAVMLGTGATIPAEALPMFSGRRVRIAADANPTGMDAAERWAAQLAPVAREVQILDLRGLTRTDGEPVTDLNDLHSLCPEDFEANRELWQITDLDSRGPRVRIVPCTPPTRESQRPVTQDNPDNTGLPRLPKTGGEKEKENALCSLVKAAEGLMAENRGESSKRMFAVARHVSAFERRHGRDDSARDAAFNAWYGLSLPALDPEHCRAEYHGTFIRSIAKVRKAIGAEGDTLANAIRRADAMPYPEIPRVPDAPKGWKQVAAVCRELQRDAGEAAFFLSARDASRIIGAKHPPIGHRVLNNLEAFEVLRRVSRGEARTGGKAAEFRYLLPISPVSLPSPGEQPQPENADESGTEPL
jgi:hypothetical protein